MSLIKNVKNIFCLILALLPILSQAQSQYVDTNRRQLPLDPFVKTGQLPNGLTYYVRHNEQPKNRVVIYLVNKVGSILEDEDQRGLAHFTEHMSFNGTVHFPHNDLIDYMQKAGVRFGADINAYTTFDETVYELPLPSDKQNVLNEGIEVLHDWAQSATLDSVEINKERGVVLEEERLGKGASDRMQSQYFPVLYNDSRYSKRMPIGIDSILTSFKRDQIARFYHDWYRPDLQAVIIVGDINADSLVNIIKQKFSDLKNPDHERPHPNYAVNLVGKNQFIAITDKEMIHTQIAIIVKHPGSTLRSYADYDSTIIRSLFNRMINERYAELNRRPNVPFIESSASVSNLTNHIDAFQAVVTLKPMHFKEGIKALWREIERVKRFGFTQTELDRAKIFYLNIAENRLEEKNKTSSFSFVKEYQDLFLNKKATPGIEEEYKIVKDDLPKIRLADFDRFVKSYITKTNRDIIILAPEIDKSTLPAMETVTAWMQQIEGEHLQPYKDNVNNKPLLAIQPVPGKIVVSKTDTELKCIKYSLSNGIKVIFKPTNFMNDQFDFGCFASGGTSLADDSDFQSAHNSADIIRSSGLGNYDANQLSKFLEDKQIFIVPFITEIREGITGYTTNKNLETTMQMIFAYFTEPRKDKSIFTGIIDRTKTELLHRSDDPKNVFKDTVNAILGNYNIRRTAPNREQLNQVKLDKAFGFYKSRFSNAGNFTFVFVGNIDTDKFKVLIEKYLGGLPATNKYERFNDLGIHDPSGIINRIVYKGSEQKSTVVLVYSGGYEYNQANEIKFDALKECLEIRLLQRLREDESGVYTPEVLVNTAKYPEQRYNLVIQFGCSPQNVDKLIASANDEVAKLKTEGPLQENLNKWRIEDKTDMETELKTNNFWSHYITTRLENDQPLNEIKNYPLIRDSITVNDIKKMANQYLSGKNYMRLVLMPETGVASK